MARFSRRHIDIFLISFLEKDLTLHANCDNLHEVSNPIFKEK